MSDHPVAQVQVMQVDELYVLRLFVPQVPDGARQQTQSTAGPLEVRDGREPFVQHADERWVKRVRAADLSRPARPSHALRQVQPSTECRIGRVGVGSTYRNGGAWLNGVEQAACEDLRKVGFLARREHQFLARHQRAGLTDRFKHR